MSSPEHDSSPDSDEVAEKFMELVELQKQVLQSYYPQPAPEPARAKRPRSYVHRDREEAHVRLMQDYFVDNPTYGPTFFRRRFRMQKELFLRIVDAVQGEDIYFHMTTDALGRDSLSPLQKCTSAIRQLATGVSADVFDEYLKVADSTGRLCLKKFCKAVIRAFGAHYLRRPTATDVQRLLRMHEARHGFPGMLGSLDCMHWAWKNCPKAWHGAYTRGDQGEPTLILEAVASFDLWIWHAFFGVAGSNNDINVLNQSPLFSDVLGGTAAPVVFHANQREYRMGYYLCDGIYPEWRCFVKSPSMATNPKEARFKKMQESARKDVERAFGVLQARWGIIRCPARNWYVEHLKDIMLCCIILHNMIVEHEGEAAANWRDDDGASSSGSTESAGQTPVAFEEYVRRDSLLRDRQLHAQLRYDLTEHLWARFGPLGPE
ncbi:uncharacterized protein LOC131021087 [Salvia miltiorrhiza]|uniref:uncharacterized protein LOC130992656 n=1 Tax=Salvia miltiorrhiza TaxID=226208 RepID=UPI0025ABB6D9|nr:uncharacterized protein LOC130992656 [Salvia miltiorrhiza]XP_057806160.1 uncharacterized protein LOC131021087 [Salvia miltiorrhiza]